MTGLGAAVDRELEKVQVGGRGRGGGGRGREGGRGGDSSARDTNSEQDQGITQSHWN